MYGALREAFNDMKPGDHLKPIHVAFADKSKGGAMRAFGDDVSAKERTSFKQIIHVAFISVVALFIFLVVDMCLVLLHVTGKADTISFSLEGTTAKAVVGTGIGLMVWGVAWVLIQFWRKPHKSPKEVLRKASKGVLWYTVKKGADSGDDMEKGEAEEKDEEAQDNGTGSGAELKPTKKNAVMPIQAGGRDPLVVD